MRRSSPTPSSNVVSDANQPDASQRVFLTPAWIHKAAEVVKSAQQVDVHFKNLLADYSLRVTYIIGDIPNWMTHWYEDGSQAVVRVQLRRGVMQAIRLGGAEGKDEADLVVNLSYGTAKRLFLGELSSARAILSGDVRAEPATGFRRWTKIAAHSLVTAGRVLRIVRRVPTVFEPTELTIPEEQCATES